MNENQSPNRQDDRQDIGPVAGSGRGNRWLFGCLAVSVFLVVAIGLALVLLTDNGAQRPDAAQEGQQVAGAENATGQPGDSSSQSVPGEESEPVTGTASSQPSASTVGPEESESVEPTVTELPVTAEPTATATAIPEITVPAPTDSPETGGQQLDVSGRIAVIDARARLWTVAADGADRRQLSESGRFYQFPSWSPTGNDIAVIGSDFEGGGVYVVADDDDSEMRQLYADNVEQPIYLYWSPAGDSVSFIASQERGGLGLHLAPKDGLSPAELVATSPSTFFWDWMPDGSQVLIHTGFTALDIDHSRLAFIQLDDALDPAEIIQHGYFQAPAVASDGRFYSYSDEDPAGRRWLIVWDIENEEQVELVFHQGVVAMGFSPTRAQLAYISPELDARSFYGPLRLLDLEGGEAQTLVPQVVLAYFWSPDGQSIAYLTLEELDDPLDFDDAPVAMQSTLSRSRALSKIQPPPDEESTIGLGLSVIDVDSGEVRRLAVFEPSDTFISQFLPFFDQYALSHHLWSPDSQALVMPMKDSNNRDFIVVVPADGSEPVTVARGVVAFWSR